MSEKPTLTLPNAPQAQPARVEAEKAKRRRRSDTSETRNLKLHVPKDHLDPKYSYRFVNDSPGRVQQLTQHDDWEIVPQTDENMPTRRHVGRDGATGQGKQAILVRKPKEFFEEDKAKSAEAIKKREEGLRRGVTDPGKGLAPTEYVPGGSNTIERGR